MAKVTSSEKIIRRLYEITNSHALGFDKQVEQLLKMGLERFNLDIAILSKIEGNKYLVKRCVVPDDVELSSGVEFDFSSTYCHITCHADKPVALEHVGQHDQYASHPAYQSFGLESYIGMPLKLNGQLYGTINFSSPTPYNRKFHAVDIDALQLMTSWVEVELIRRKQEKQLIELNAILEKKAYQDSLTAIPNRRAAFKHINSDLNRISRENNTAVLAIMDIDFFKQINDNFGHQVGDDVLVQVAKTIADSKRDYDYLARFGGEEFLLWLPNINLDKATKVCERIKDQVAALSSQDKNITISIGLTLFSPEDTQQIQIKANAKAKIDELITQADNALYQAKGAGRNCIKTFSNQ